MLEMKHFNRCLRVISSNFTSAYITNKIQCKER